MTSTGAWAVSFHVTHDLRGRRSLPCSSFEAWYIFSAAVCTPVQLGVHVLAGRLC